MPSELNKKISNSIDRYLESQKNGEQKNYIAAYTSAPLKRYIMSKLNGEQNVDLGFGSDPNTAPSGEAIARKLGVPEAPVTDTSMMNWKTGVVDPKGGPSGNMQQSAGMGIDLGVDFVSDPTNLVPNNMIGGIAGRIQKIKGATKAQKILKEFDTVEKVRAIRGTPQYEEYLKALTSEYGDVAKRSKDMGFGDRTWYHGTTNDIDEFNNDFLGKNTNANSAKKGYFFAEDASTASDYADLSPSRAIIRQRADLGKFDKAYYDKLDELYAKYNPNQLEFPHWRDRLESGLELSVPDSEFEKFNKISKERNKAWDFSADEGSDFSKLDAIERKLKQKENLLRKLNNQDPIDIQVRARIKEKIDAYSNRIERIKAAPFDYDPQALEQNSEVLKKLNSDLENTFLKPSQKEITEVKSSITDLSKKRDAASDAYKSKGQNVMPVKLKGDKSNIHVKDYNGQGYRDTTFSDEMSKAQSKGKTGVLFRNTYDPADSNNRVQQDIAAVFNPNQIRSKFAAFDPRFADSADLLAGASGPGFNPIQIRLQSLKENQEKNKKSK